MTARTSPVAHPADRELLLTRVFDAPRETVWKAWTDPKHVSQWWGPRGFTTRVTKLDLRPGGRWSYVMVGPDAQEYPVSGTFQEVKPPERIVTSDEFDEDFERAHGANLPRGIVLTIEFEELGRKTRITLRISHATPDDRRRHEEMGVVTGWNSSFEKLDDHLEDMVNELRGNFTLSMPSDREIRITREFNAPRRLVFEAFTKPEHVRQWWGLRGSILPVCQMDVRAGGSWRYVLRGPDGQDYPFCGVYREIDPPKKIVRTFIFDVDGIRDHEAVETMLFDEHDGKTTITATVLHKTREGRDGHLQSGMEAGCRECYSRLDELLEKMANG